MDVDRLTESLRTERARSARLEACIRKHLPADVAAAEMVAASVAEGINPALDQMERKVAKRKKKRRQPKKRRWDFSSHDSHGTTRDLGSRTSLLPSNCTQQVARGSQRWPEHESQRHAAWAE